MAIDACVQRRPPAAKLSKEDEAVDRLAQLVSEVGTGTEAVDSLAQLVRSDKITEAHLQLVSLVGEIYQTLAKCLPE